MKDQTTPIKDLKVDLQLSSYSGGGGGSMIRVMDNASGLQLLSLNLTYEELGLLLAGREVSTQAEVNTSDKIGKIHEHMRLLVDWLLDRDEWRTHEGESTVDEALRRWLATEEADLWNAGWRPDRLASDRSTSGTGFNGHRVSPEGYEIILRRYVEVEEQAS